MDTLLYKILLLFVGLAFLFLQSKDFKSVKNNLVKIPQHYVFAKLLGIVDTPALTSPYPLHLSKISWQTLASLSEQEIDHLAQMMNKKHQKLIVIFPVFAQECIDTLAIWKNFEKLPIQYCELSAAQSDVPFQDIMQLDRALYLQNFQYFLETLKGDFPTIQYFVWGAFDNPSSSKEILWNMLLAQFQKYWHGYVVNAQNPTALNFQALLRARVPLGIHLHSQTEQIQQWLNDFLFIFNSAQYLPLVYIEQQEANANVWTIHSLLARLLWRSPIWQATSLVNPKGENIKDVYVWLWHKNWDTGMVIINLSNQKQIIDTNKSEVFPSFFYQELFCQDAQSTHFKIQRQVSQGNYKAIIPPQSMAFLSNAPLPFIGEKNYIVNFEVRPTAPDTITLHYQLLENTRQVVLRLFDLTGNEIYYWQKKKMKAGFYEMHYQAKALVEGHYLCSISADGKNFIYDFDFFPSQM